MATQTIPIASPQRKSALLLCHWLYGVSPDIFKIEILVLATPVATIAGGFDTVLAYEARVSQQDLVDQSERLVLVYQFQNSVLARAQIANGEEPLFKSFESGSDAVAKVQSNAPALAAIYVSLTLNTATPAVLSSIKGPRL